MRRSKKSPTIEPRSAASPRIKRAAEECAPSLVANFTPERLEMRVLFAGGATATSNAAPLQNIGINLNLNSSVASAALWVDTRKGFSPWYDPANGNFLAAPNITATGYPLVAASADNNLSGYPNGVYTLQYQGTATFTFTGKGTIIGTPVTSNGVTTAQVYVRNDLAGKITMTVSNLDPNNPLHDLHLIMPGFPANTTQVFNPNSLRRLGPFGDIRLMDEFSTNSSTVANWSDRTTTNDFAYTTNAGIAYEDAIALGNALHRDLWWNVPVSATTQFMTNLAELLKFGSDASGNPYTSVQASPVNAPLDPTLKVHIEYVNELWHSGFPAEAVNLANAQANSSLPGNSLPGGANWDPNLALEGEQNVFKLRQLYTAFSGVYGGSLSSQVGFIFETVDSNTDFTKAAFAYMQANSGSWGAPSTWLEALAVPSYIGLTSQEDVAGLTLDQLFADLSNHIQTDYTQSITDDVTLANSASLPLYTYEGGQSLIPNNDNAALKLQAQTDPRMGQFYTALLNKWFQLGGSQFEVYSFTDYANSYGAWGLLSQNDTPGNPKWDAVISRLVPAGDASLDGTVDYNDFLRLKSYWGTANATFEQGDFNGDGTVGPADLTILKNNLNTTNLSDAQQTEISAFPGNVGTGVRAIYYSDATLNTPVFSRVDAGIHQNWDTTSPSPLIDRNLFSVKWTGTLEAPTSEFYSFVTNSDDGVTVKINGIDIINDFTGGVHEDVGSIALQAGQTYSLEVDYNQAFGNANVDLRWQSPTIPLTDVPTSLLTPDAAPTPAITVAASTPAASENGVTAIPGGYTLTRVADLTDPLTVSYSLSGTATSGVDYAALSGSATFAAGSNTTTVTLTPLVQSQLLGNRSATLTLTADPSYTISGATSATVTITDTLSSLPGWSDSDIGFPTPAGIASYDGSNYSVSGGGFDIYGTFDQFNLLSHGVVGDVTLGGTVSLPTTAAVNAKAGLVLRDGSSPGAVYAGIFLNGDGSLHLQYRPSSGAATSLEDGPTVTGPVQLRITRQNNDFTGYYSTNGTDWIAIGPAQTLTASSTLLAGLAVTSHDNNNLTTGTFTNVAFNGTDMVNVAANPATTTEGGPAAQDGKFTFTRLGDLTAPLTVNYTLSGTAAEGTDYTLSPAQPTDTLTSGTVVFATGSSTTTLTLAPLASGQGTTLTSLLAIAAGNGYVLGAQPSDTITINELPTVTLAATTSSAVPGATPPENGVWTFTRNGATTAALSVPFTLTGTGVEATDYTLASSDSTVSGLTASGGTITFAAGATTATLTLTALASSGGKTAILTLGTGSFDAGAQMSGTVSITAAAVPTIASLTASAPPINAGAQFSLTASGVADSAGTVSSVNFYLVPAGALFSTGTPVAGVLQSPGVWKATLTAPAGGNYTAYAQAIDSGTGSKSVPASTPVTVVASTTALPAGFTDADINSPAVAGSAAFDGTTWTVKGSGHDIWNNADLFNFASTSLTGDTTLVTEVTSLTNTDQWAKAGLMLRDGASAGAANAAIFATPSNGVSFQWRATAGGRSDYINVPGVPAPSANSPVWLKLVRSGNTFTASYSTDGVSYTTIGTQTLNLSSTLLAGLAVTSHNNNVLATATFANVAIPASSGTVTAPATPSLTATAASGAVNLSWAAVPTANSYNLYRSTTPGGEGTTPYLTALTGTGYVDTPLTPGVAYYYTLTAVNSGVPSAPSTEQSATPTAVTSSGGSLADSDIGNPAVAGSASFNSGNGVWTLHGSGADIWNNADLFNFASTSLTGDTTLITQVTSLTNTDQWAKAGLMLRDGTAAGAANVAVFATPSNGVSLQWRSTLGGRSDYINIPGIPAPSANSPVWLKLVRSGNTFTASYSTDGVSYTTIGTQTVALSGTLLAGLAVTSHNNNVLATATFANVGISASTGTVTTPAIPTLTATAAAGAVNLAWAAVPTATSYNLYRSTTPGGEGTTPYLTALTGTGYVDTPLTPGVAYYYTLTAVNSGVPSAPSTEQSATPTAVTSSGGSLADSDIGNPAVAGSASFNSGNGVWTLHGSGADIWNNADLFNFASTSLTGDTTLVTEVTSLTNTDQWAKAGLMLRDGASAGTANAAIFATPSNGVSFQWRSTIGGISNYVNVPGVPAPSTNSPVWLKLVRSGNTFTAYYSTDGVTYTTIGTQTLTLSGTLLGGLAVTSHNNNVLATATFANVAIPASSGTVTAPATPSLTATAASGAVNLSWAAVPTANSYNLYRSTTPGGEGTTPYLTALTGTGYVDTPLTPGVAYYYTLTAVNSGVPSAPSTEQSATPTAVTSSGGSLADSDIGNPAVAGSASFNSGNGVWTLHGSGADIWNNADLFNFASTSLTGDTTLITQVTSLTNTDQWAKAGLMLRDGTAAGAANVAVFATPSNGVSLQWRSTLGGRSDYINIPGIPAPSANSPVWLKLVRSGNTFTASYSTDGVSYTTIGTQTVALSGTLLAGLAVTSHNNNVLATATFANVAVG